MGENKNIARDVSGLAWKGGPPAYGMGASGSGCLYLLLMMLVYPILLLMPLWVVLGLSKLIDLLTWLGI